MNKICKHKKEKSQVITTKKLDVVAAKFREDCYMKKDVAPDKDVYFCIEVADKSLEKDRTEKMLTYAKADIVEYWIINLQHNQIEVFQQPENGDYTIREIVKDGKLTCESIGFTVDVGELFSHLEKTL